MIGGALTGLSSALFLAARGVDVLLVERHPNLLSHPRLRGITPRTVELYREVGLQEAITEQSFIDITAEDVIPFVPLRAETLADEYEPVAEAGDAFVDPRTYSPCTYGSIDQDKLENLLRAKAGELGARLHYSTELVSFESDAEGVTAVLRNRDDASTGSDGAWTVRADYLIAADGAKSPVRERLGIESDGPGVLFETITAMVRADLADVVRGRPIGIAYVQRPRPFSTMMPHDDAGTEWLFSTGLDTRSESIEDFTDERVAEMVAEAAGKPGVEVTLRPQIPGTNTKVLGFAIGARVAREYQSGRIFLVGDAARIQPPTGGFGGSTGVQDAHNLAWKLAAVLGGWAGPGLLATYHQERQPYGVLAMQQAFARFGDRMAGGAEVELLDTAAVTAGYRYASSAVLGGSEERTPLHPLDLDASPGTRAPHRELPDGSSTLDWFSAAFVLVAAEENVEAWTAAGRKCADLLGAPVAVRSVSGEIAEAYRIAGTGSESDAAAAVLVRPDGFVGWRAPAGAADPTTELERALRAILDR